MVSDFLMIARALPVSFRSRRSFLFDARVVLAVVAVAILAAGCDKVPLLAPTGSTITLTAPTRILPTGGTTDVTATVLEGSGSPVQNGTTVRFTTTLGRVDPVEVQTVNGVAITRFFAGDSSGVAEIRANSGAAGGGTSTGGTGTTTPTATNVLQITVGAAATDSVLVRTNPSSVSPTGGTVEVIASVLGAGGRALANVPVTFSASRGSLSSTLATTDANGEARVQLTTNVETTVTASAGGKTSTAATVTVRATPNVTLTCAGTGAAGASCSQLAGSAVTFTVSRGTSTSALVRATLDFGDGSSTSLGNLSSTATVTHVYQSPGTYTATVTSTDVNGEQTSASAAVTITTRTPLSVTITAASDLAVPGQGQRWTFTANVTPATGGADMVESYTWDFGDGTSATTSGNQTAHVYGPGSNGRKTVTVTVRTTDGRTGVGRTEIIVSGT